LKLKTKIVMWKVSTAYRR